MSQFATEDKVVQWGLTRGIVGPYGKGTIQGQMEKLEEEVLELLDALESGDLEEVADALGDIQVVCTLLGYMMGLRLSKCFDDAYEVISKRTGTMVDGIFVKDEPPGIERTPLPDHIQNKMEDILSSKEVSHG